jgi:site-specific DNA-cytosine methylase
MPDIEIRHFHLFCGLGGGAKGFNRGRAQVGKLRAAFRCIGGVDVDPAAVLDFKRLTGVPATALDMFDREQYLAFHGHEPPEDWREATPADIRNAAGNDRPHIVFLSAPCKGFSGLLSESRSKGDK